MVRVERRNRLCYREVYPREKYLSRIRPFYDSDIITLSFHYFQVKRVYFDKNLKFTPLTAKQLICAMKLELML